MRETLLQSLEWLFILVPIGIGFFRIREIEKSYYWFIAYLCLDLVYSSISPFITNIKFINIWQLIYGNLSLLINLNILFKWGFLKNKSRLKNIIIVGLISVVLIDAIIEPHDKIEFAWLFITNYIILIFIMLQFLAVTRKESITKNTRYSRMLIFLPITVGGIYYIVLQILMAFLYDANTQALFIKLYYVVTYLTFANHICYSIAILLAPKKEIFLGIFEDGLTPVKVN